MRCIASAAFWITMGLAATASAQSEPSQSAPSDRTKALSIYTNGIASVTMTRSVNLNAGPARLAIDNLSPGLIPDSLDLDAPDTSVIEQRELPWPITRQDLLQRALGQTVILIRTPQTAEAPVTREVRLLSVSPDIVIQDGDRIETNPPGRIALDSLPKDMPTSPTAVFDIASETAGTRDLHLRYLTNGIRWNARYVARWDRQAQTLSINGRAQLTNDLSRPLAADTVTLVSGQVATTPSQQQRPRGDTQMMAMEAAAMSKRGGTPTPEAANDLRLYELPGAVTLPAGTTISRELLTARDIPIETRYRVTGLATNHPYDRLANGREDRRTAELRVRIADTRAAGLAKALPAGEMHVYDGDLFRGAQQIADTPLGTELALDLGGAVDVTATGARTAYDKLSRDSYEIGRRIAVKNAKRSAVEVHILGDFIGDWDMISESVNHEIEDSGNPVWTVPVPPESETVLTYRVRVQR